MGNPLSRLPVGVVEEEGVAEVEVVQSHPAVIRLAGLSFKPHPMVQKS